MTRVSATDTPDSLLFFAVPRLDVLPQSPQAKPGHHRLKGLERVQGVGQDRAELDDDEGGDDGEVEDVIREGSGEEPRKGF